jgi:dynactin complex subunit
MTPDEIERLFEGTNPAEGSDSEDVEDDASLSNEVHNFRIRQLKEVLQVAEEAWASGSEILDQVAEKLANGSRDGQFGYVQ